MSATLARRLSTFLAAAALLGVMPGGALADGGGANRVRGAGPEQAHIGVRVIHATPAGRIDGRLDGKLGRTLTKAFKGYKGFTQLDARTGIASAAREQTMALPNGIDLSYAYLGMNDGYLRVRIEVGGLKSTVKVKNGGTFFQAGRGFKDGMIVLAIDVRRRK